MIDVTAETILSLADAAKRLPARRAGKRPHVSCLYRWTVSGCRGVRLESVQIGGTRCTSEEALQRFFERLSADPAAEPPLSSAARPLSQRQKAAQRAADELGRMGV